MPFWLCQHSTSRAVAGGRNVSPRPSSFLLQGAQLRAWACGELARCPGLRGRLTSTCALLPQPTRRAFDLDWLHGKNVHGCFQLPPHPGVRHDEPGQGLRHRTFEFLWAEEHLRPLHVRTAPPTPLPAKTFSGLFAPSAKSPNTCGEPKDRWPRGRASRLEACRVKSVAFPPRSSCVFWGRGGARQEVGMGTPTFR